MSKSYYVYKYVVNDEIIYIGLTDNLSRRIKEHASGIGLESKFLPYLSEADIYYHECGNETEMRALESLLINKYKPKLNVVDVCDGDSTISTQIDWTIYDGKSFNDNIQLELKRCVQSLRANQTRIANYQAKQEELSRKMWNLRPFYNQIADNFDSLAKNPYMVLLIPKQYLPTDDFAYVGDRYVAIWYDEQDMQNDQCAVQLSGEFLRELFAIGHQDNWIEKTMDMVGNNQCRDLAEKIANLSRTNDKLKRRIMDLQQELLSCS